LHRPGRHGPLPHLRKALLKVISSNS